MKSKKQKSYENKRITLMEMNYEKTLRDVYKQLDMQYKSTLKEIEEELKKWEEIRENDKRPSTFGYSEEKALRESKKAIELLINALAENEYQLLNKAMSDLYAKDLLDMSRLEIEYLQWRDDNELAYMLEYALKNTSFEDFQQRKELFQKMSTGVANRTDTIKMVEHMLRQPIPTKMLSQDIWYKGCQGKSYGERIAIRGVQLQKEINQAINSMYIQGESYEYATKRIAERCKVSNSHAKRLVANECRIAESTATVNHYTDTMGVKYFKRSTAQDSDVCPICKKHKNDIYTSEELKNNPFKSMLHVGDRCVLIPLSSKKGEELYRSPKNTNR